MADSSTGPGNKYNNAEKLGSTPTKTMNEVCKRHTGTNSKNSQWLIIE